MSVIRHAHHWSRDKIGARQNEKSATGKHPGLLLSCTHAFSNYLRSKPGLCFAGLTIFGTFLVAKCEKRNHTRHFALIDNGAPIFLTG
jgi:hypothetical protein